MSPRLQASPNGIQVKYFRAPCSTQNTLGTRPQAQKWSTLANVIKTRKKQIEGNSGRAQEDDGKEGQRCSQTNTFTTLHDITEKFALHLENIEEPVKIFYFSIR